MESSAPQINTQRLKPFCQRTSRTVMSILENGDISMEILAKPQSGSQETSQIVQEMIYIKEDGTKVQIYQNNQQGSIDKSGTAIGWSCQEFIFPDLPPKQLKKYMHAHRFVELVKSRTPKIVLITDKAKCKLMENSPIPDFQVDFHDGMAVLLSKRKVHITDSDGNSLTSDIDSLSENIPSDVLERFWYLKECESECLRLEDSFNNLNAQVDTLGLFPITIGTSTSPVFIPLPQPTTSPCVSSSNLSSHAVTAPHSHDSKESSVYLEPKNFSDSPFSNDSIQSQNAFSTPAQPLDPSANMEFFESSVINAFQQVNCLFQSATAKPCATSVGDSRYLSPQISNDSIGFQMLHNSLPSISNPEFGAEVSNFCIPQLTQHCLENENNNDNLIPTVPCSLDSLSQPCLSDFSTLQEKENITQVFHAGTMSEGYNKFKYCSRRRSQDEVGVYNDTLEEQQESDKKDLFIEQPDISGQAMSDNKKVPALQDCANPEHVCTDHILLQQNVHLGSNESETPLLSMHSIFTSSEDSFYSQRTDPFSSSNSKRNSIVSSSSSLIGVGTSNYVTKEKIDSNEVFSFNPVHSSSIITTYSNSDNLQCPKKLQRKIASPCMSSLEKEIESLDLSSTQSDSQVMSENLTSFGNEKSEATCFHDIQRMPKKNPGHCSYNNPVNVKMINGQRSRDSFNMSLPLYDSRQHSVSSMPFPPQRQFLQSSDNDFALPPQVRNSLDLSTSSNYSDSPSSSQSSSCEPLYQVFVPYTGWASYYASGAVWVLYNDGTQLGVKASEKTMTFIDQDGTHKKYNNKDAVPEIVKMKLERFPSVLNAVLSYKS